MIIGNFCGIKILLGAAVSRVYIRPYSILVFEIAACDYNGIVVDVYVI
jgi:hypothetical protein